MSAVLSQETTSVELTAVILDRLAVLAMLHDVGKVNSGFSKANPA